MKLSRLLLAPFFGAFLLIAETPRFKVVTYNLENYLVERSGTRVPKPEAARRKVTETLTAIRPDVLAIQEIGPTNALLELQSRLRQSGLDLPHWEHVSGYDTNIFVAVLSRFPIVARRPHSQENFLLEGRRFKTSRGLLEVDLEVSPSYRFTLFTAHLKSKRTIGSADQAEMREQGGPCDAWWKPDSPPTPRPMSWCVATSTTPRTVPPSRRYWAGPAIDPSSTPAQWSAMGIKPFGKSTLGSTPCELDPFLRERGFLQPHRLHLAEHRNGP